MKSANNELTTARSTPNPIVAAGKDDAPVPGKSSIAPTSSQGLAVNLCCDSHHAMMAPIGARTNSIVMLTARGSLSCSWYCRLVLRYEILLGAWHAVIVSPTIDHRQLLAPVAMPRRGFGCLPLQRGGPPGIAAGRLALGQAPDHVEQEHHLGEAHDQCRHGDEAIQRRGRLRNESHIAHLEIPARHTQQAYIVHGEVNRIGPEERDPEVKLAEHLVQHSPGDLRVPVVDRTENHENARHAQQ